MAQVFEAVIDGDKGFRRRVAIKRVLPELRHEVSLTKMFADEARIAGALHHANIVQTIDFGVVDGSEFMVVEFVDGCDAGKAARVGRTNGKPMPHPVALYIAAQLGHALQHAHEACDDSGRWLKIVHRDVSPSNVLLSWEGDVKLSDFGIAVAEERLAETTIGIVKGKELFMAPEHRAGVRVDGAADVFSLALALAHMVSGSLPVDLATLPEDLREIVDAGTQLDPKARPTASAFAEQCERALGARGVSSPRNELAEWLRGIRAFFGDPSALDQMLDVLLVPVDGTQRTFAAVGPELPKKSDPPTVVASNTTAAPIAHGVSKPSAYTTPAIAIVTMIVGAVALYAGLQSSGNDSRPARSRVVEPSEVKAVAEDTPQVTTPSRVEPLVAVVAEARVDAATGPQVGHTRVTRHRDRSTENAPAAHTPTRSGYVRFTSGRAGVPNALVEVDGRALDSTPFRRELTVGNHTVRMRDSAGQLLWETRIEVTELHTLASALVVRLQ